MVLHIMLGCNAAGTKQKTHAQSLASSIAQYAIQNHSLLMLAISAQAGCVNSIQCVHNIWGQYALSSGLSAFHSYSCQSKPC